MREYTVQRSSLNFTWTFDRMLPSLPGPGSPAFAELCKGLHLYGMIPSMVTVDTPTIRFGDLNVGIGLLDNRVTVRFTSAAIEIFVNELLVGDEEKFISIADLVFAAVRAIDPDATQGKAALRAYSHLKLPPGEVDRMLEEHSNYTQHVPAFIPDAVVYKVSLEESRAKQLRVAIAKSLAYPDAVFIDINADYDGPITSAELAEEMNHDSERIMEKLSLAEAPEPSEIL